MKLVRATLLGLACVAMAGPLLAAEPAESVESAARPAADAAQPLPDAGGAAAAGPAATLPQASAESVPAPLALLPGRQGYAFEKRDILARQRIFGLAHGVSLLAAACLDLPAQAGAIEEAYAAWHAKQAATIETVVHDLARYYFGPHAEEAQWPDLVRALGLKQDIGAALGEFSLEVACVTLPQVLDKPRYDLSALLADPSRFDAPSAATAPAPTPAAPAPTPAPAPAADTQVLPDESLPASGTSAADAAVVAGPRSGIPGVQGTPAPSTPTEIFQPPPRP
ncbi:MAG: hypothetical protein CVU17_08560 [Betaproteobacteria bacterium HGW-Betaproteobacteria-11]|nr:MAG: hypothetical protein CVU17_08560 [Betaproteobacteria bacterium HGW-Betaproteobacteria-11]